ncbi:MAG: hypothetical protein JJE04_11230 [Acidobacteriia bacterium]|nr:hypothetical protein [Terriglobia bacterium]
MRISIWDFIKEAFWDVFEEMAAEVLGLGITLGLFLAAFLVFGVPIYLILKKLGYRRGASSQPTTFWEDVREAVHFKPSQPDPATLERLRQLDAVESGVSTFYRYFLYVVFVLVTGFIIFFFWSIRNDVNRDFMYFYFGILYLVFLGWAAGQFYELRRRTNRRKRRQTAQAQSDNTPAAFEFSFSTGDNPMAESTSASGQTAQAQSDNTPDAFEFSFSGGRNPMAEATPGSGAPSPGGDSQPQPGMSTTQLVIVGVVVALLLTGVFCTLFMLRLNAG